MTATTTTTPTTALPDINATPTDEQLVSFFLRDHDAPCPRCGYSLRGLTGATCPECDERLSLTIGNAEGRRLFASALRLFFLWPVFLLGALVSQYLITMLVVRLNPPANFGTMYIWVAISRIAGQVILAIAGVVAIIYLRPIRRGQAVMRSPRRWRRAALIVLLVYTVLASGLWYIPILLLL